MPLPLLTAGVNRTTASVSASIAAAVSGRVGPASGCGGSGCRSGLQCPRGCQCECRGHADQIRLAGLAGIDPIHVMTCSCT